VTARGSGRLTRPALDTLLRRPLLARLATVDPGGYPAIVPVWIEWDGSAAWIVARAGAGYVADVRRDPRVCLSVVADDDPDLRAQLFGRAEVVVDAAPLAGRTLEIARRMARRYEGKPGLAYIERSRDWPRVLLRVVPSRIVSWGSADWHARYLPDRAAPSEPALPERSDP